MILEGCTSIFGRSLHLLLTWTARRLYTDDTHKPAFRRGRSIPKGITVNDLIAHHRSSARDSTGSMLSVNRLARTPSTKRRLFGCCSTTLKRAFFKQCTIGITDGYLCIMRFIGYRSSNARDFVVVVNEDRCTAS